MPNMPLVILAAGRGRRLKPFTDETPKALIEFEGKTITEMIIDAFAEYVSEVVIVVGHLADKITERLGESRNGVPIVYVHNRVSELTGAATSLSKAKHHFAGKPCVIMEGDHLVHPYLIRRLMGNTGYMNCVLVDIGRPLCCGEEVLALRNAMTTSQVDKLVWPASDLPEKDSINVAGEALAIFRLSSSASASLAAHLKPGEIIEPINKVFARRRLHYLTTMGKPWIEIDTPADLERAQTIYEQIKESEK